MLASLISDVLGRNQKGINKSHVQHQKNWAEFGCQTTKQTKSPIMAALLIDILDLCVLLRQWLLLLLDAAARVVVHMDFHFVLVLVVVVVVVPSVCAGGCCVGCWWCCSRSRCTCINLACSRITQSKCFRCEPSLRVDHDCAMSILGTNSNNNKDEHMVKSITTDTK